LARSSFANELLNHLMTNGRHLLLTVSTLGVTPRVRQYEVYDLDRRLNTASITGGSRWFATDSEIKCLLTYESDKRGAPLELYDLATGKRLLKLPSQS